MYSASDLKKGLKLEVDGQPWVITKFDFSKPGKGQSIYKCTMKNMITGSTKDRSYRSNDKFTRPALSEREFTYVYADGDEFVFSDDATYEEVRIQIEDLGFRKNFLVENDECRILFFNDTPIDVELPIFVELAVKETDPNSLTVALGGVIVTAIWTVWCVMMASALWT